MNVIKQEAHLDLADVIGMGAWFLAVVDSYLSAAAKKISNSDKQELYSMVKYELYNIVQKAKAQKVVFRATATFQNGEVVYFISLHEFTSVFVGSIKTTIQIINPEEEEGSIEND